MACSACITEMRIPSMSGCQIGAECPITCAKLDQALPIGFTDGGARLLASLMVVHASGCLGASTLCLGFREPGYALAREPGCSALCCLVSSGTRHHDRATRSSTSLTTLDSQGSQSRSRRPPGGALLFLMFFLFWRPPGGAPGHPP
jgi:hypothetical protein